MERGEQWGWVGAARQDQSREEAVDVTVTAAIVRLPGGHEGSGIEVEEVERVVINDSPQAGQAERLQPDTRAESSPCLQQMGEAIIAYYSESIQIVTNVMELFIKTDIHRVH